MSDAEQFTAAVPERSDPKDWRGGLERSGARWGRVGWCSSRCGLEKRLRTDTGVPYCRVSDDGGWQSS